MTILCPLRTNPHFWNYCEANQWTGRVQWLHCFHWEPTRTFGTILWSKQANWKSTATTLCPLRTNPHFWNYCKANKWTGRVQWLYCVHWEPTRTFGTIVKQTSELEEYSDYIVSTENQPALLELYCEANKRTGRVQRLILWRGAPHPDWLQSIKLRLDVTFALLLTAKDELGRMETLELRKRKRTQNWSTLLVEKADRRPCFFSGTKL